MELSGMLCQTTELKKGAGEGSERTVRVIVPHGNELFKDCKGVYAKKGSMIEKGILTDDCVCDWSRTFTICH